MLAPPLPRSTIPCAPQRPYRVLVAEARARVEESILDAETDDWQADESPPDSLGAPCRLCQRPTLSTLRDLCANCEADQKGWEP